MKLENLRCEISGAIATVTIDRPPVNAVDAVTYRELRDLFRSIDTLGDDVRAVVLTGAGRHFCAGNDLHEFETLSPDNAGERMREVREAFFAIQDCPVPVIGAVAGSALGSGLAIAASCDFVVAAEGAAFGTPEIGVGVMGAAKHLSRLVPQPIARWMFLSGEPAAAETLERYGGVVAIVPRERLLAEARERAAAIVRHSPLAIRAAKRSLNTIEAMELKDGYRFEQGLTAELSGTSDAKEAVRAFFEGRAPRYTGR